MTPETITASNIDKTAVQRAFARAAPRYTKSAQIQKQIGRELARYADVTLSTARTPRLAVNAGCGSEPLPLIAPLKNQDDHWLALDFALPMLAHQMGSRLCADIEQLPLATASIDVYWSNLAWQWCRLAQVVAEASRVLRPHGLLVASTLTTGTFIEVDRAFDRAGLAGSRTLTCLPLTTIAATLNTHFTESRCHLRSFTVYFADAASLFASIKQVGAQGIKASQQGLMGKAARARLYAALETERGHNGLPLTYQAVLIEAKR